jgi:hypothetical protein
MGRRSTRPEAFMARDWIDKQFDRRQDARIRGHQKNAFRSRAEIDRLKAQIRARSQGKPDTGTYPHSALADDMFVAYCNVKTFLEDHVLPTNPYSRLHAFQKAWLSRTEHSVDSISTEPDIDRFLEALQYDRIVSALSPREDDKATLDQLDQLLRSFIRLRDQYRART